MLQVIICIYGRVEIIHACNRLKENTYELMYEAVEDNYKRSLTWDKPFERLKNKIIELI